MLVMDASGSIQGRPSWITVTTSVKFSPVTVTVPVRLFSLEFSSILITISPLPNFGADMIFIQDAFLVADTGQCACVLMPISLVD